jgi:phosphatidylglycerophosphate synthase
MLNTPKKEFACPAHVVGHRLLQTEPSKKPQTREELSFNREHERIQESILAPLESKCLIWLAERTPGWVQSDHLTLLGLLSMALAGFSYWLAGWNPLALLLVNLCLALNWLGDSLDGTLARVRNQQRPRYGFYVDHMVDAFGAFFLLAGLTMSGTMSPWVSTGLLIAYLLLSIETYLATYTLGRFRLSMARMSPTELRILIAIGNLVLFFHPTVRLLGQSYRFYDAAGAIGILAILLALLASFTRNVLALYRAEPLA